jgi:DNA mismatch repair protein MutS2
LAALGFPEILAALTERAASEPGKRECREPALFESAAAADLALGETSEAVELFNVGAPPDPAPISDVIPLVEKASAGGTLEATDLVKIADVLDHAGRTGKFFKEHEEAPRLAEWASRLDGLPSFHRSLVKSVDRDGTILDSASPELKSLRKRYRTLKERIHKRLSEIVARNPETVLQDDYYTQRGQRYVVPVKASEQSKFEGIVHDASGSGQTVFVEPAELVEPNNRLKLIEAEIEAEIMRILKDLSARVARAAGEIITDQKVLAHLDAARARARLAIDLKAERPRVNDRGQIALRGARHPLLALRGQEVVPNDIEFGENFSVLVVSGPNAGGKTVGLTMLGLFALMVRAGMFIPAEQGSEMAVFCEVYAVIGDEQDISQDLSSFSAHVLDIRRILDTAGPRSLVLLDELMSSTDPEEGAALGMVTLSALMDRGALVAATTHLPALKSFAHEREGFINASYTFDPDALMPTYRLMTGVPGRSLGLEMAQRMGMSEDLVEQARSEMDQSALRMESLIGDLSAKAKKLEEEKEELEAKRREVVGLADEYRELRDRAKDHEKRIKRSVKAEVREEIRRAEAELGEMSAGPPERRCWKRGRSCAVSRRGSMRSTVSRSKTAVLPSGPA